MAKRRKKNKRKGGHATTLQKARHGAEQHHEALVSATTAAEWDSGGHGHQSPPKTDAQGVPIYGRQIYSAKALEIRLRSLDVGPVRRPSVVIAERKSQKANVVAQMQKPKVTVQAHACSHPLPPSLLTACAEFHREMGDMGGVAKQIVEEYRRDGTLSTNCAWRLFAWCYTRDERPAQMARKIWSLAVGPLPTEEEAKTNGLKRLIQ